VQIINIKSAIRNYTVHFSETTDFLNDLEEIKQRFYVIDSNVWEIYSSKLFADIDKTRVMVLPIHEERKNIDTVMEVYDAIMSCSAKRNLTLVSIGGGITQDITGFVASTLYRGLKWIFIPTTLLAQADSCIGSKTSLNYKNYKNLVGTFYPPNEVYLTPLFLNTLQGHDFYSGLGEVVKLHLMGGKNCVYFLSQNMDKIVERDPQYLLQAISNSLKVKLSYLEDDEFDMGKRNLLNFGHCFGHALETTSKFTIPHGQAVLIGILFANIVSRNRGLLTPEVFDELRQNLLEPNIMIRPTKTDMDVDSIYTAMKMDKKRTNEGLVLVMMFGDYGMCKVEDMSYNELEQANAELIKLMMNEK